MSWQAYVDSNLVGTKKITKAAIHGHDGSLWATSKGFSVRVYRKLCCRCLSESNLKQTFKRLFSATFSVTKNFGFKRCPRPKSKHCWEPTKTLQEFEQTDFTSLVYDTSFSERTTAQSTGKKYGKQSESSNLKR